MTLRTTLERERDRYDPRPDAFARLLVERRRRQQRRRVATVVVAVTFAVVAIAAAIMAFRLDVSPTPARQTPPRITPQNVRSLRVAWRAPLPHQAGALAISDGIAVVVTDLEGAPSHAHGEVLAFATDCARDGSTCRPLWTADIGRGGLMPDGPVVDDGTVYVAGDDLYAFPLRCRSDGGSCDPSWVGSVGPGTATQPVVDGTSVYVASDAGRVYAFPLGCASAAVSCAPSWESPSLGLPLLASAVADGRLYTSVVAREHTPHLNRIYTFDNACATPCRPLDVTEIRGQAFASMPAVADGIVYVGTAVNGGEGSIRAYDASCGVQASCALWALEEHEALNIPRPAIGDGIVVTATRSASHRIRAYATGRDAPAAYRWTACCTYEITDSTAVISDGLVYIASLTSGVSAYPVDCVPRRGLCGAAWSWGGEPPIGSNGARAIAVGDGTLVAAEQRGGLIAFSPKPGRAVLTAEDRSSAAAFYGGLVLVLLGALALKRRSRRRIAG